jgi:predicted acetyltransferase
LSGPGESNELGLVHVDPRDVDAFAEWERALWTVFMVGAPSSDVVRQRQDRYEAHRLTAIRDGDRTVATFRSFDTTLTLPGAGPSSGHIDVSAITNVSVLPTHRRRQLLTRLMHSELERSWSEGLAANVLISSESTIYGRFGFGMATDACTWTIDAKSALFRRERSGAVELVDSDTFIRLAPEIYESARLRHPGSLGRSAGYWQALAEAGPEKTGVLQFALHRDQAGAFDGFVVYHAEPSENERISTSVLSIIDLFAGSDGAYADLWRYCCEVDFVSTVVAANRSPHEPLPWLLVDQRHARSGPVTDLLWARINDVPTTFGSRRYPVPGRLTFEVQDDRGPAGGQYVLDVDDNGQGQCSRIPPRKEPDLTLDLRALASLWLGASRPSTLARAGQLQVRHPSLLGQAGALLSWPDPAWCGCWF